MATEMTKRTEIVERSNNSEALPNSVQLTKLAKGGYTWEIKLRCDTDQEMEAIAKMARLNQEMIQRFGNSKDSLGGNE